ncbi:MAG: DUF3618 domain-containing protein [Woeseia sp.]
MNERNNIDTNKDPAELERDIDRTRGRLGRTVDQLESRLSPGQLLDQALGVAREHGGDFATNLSRSVRNNPMPVILTGVGLAWMMASSNEPRAPSRSYAGASSEMSGKASGAKSRLQSGAESAKTAAGSVTESAARARHSLQDSASHAGERMRMERERLSHGFRNLMEEQPLLAGALGIAVGAALGAAFPKTQSEDRLMGDASESVADSAKERAQQAFEEARDHAAEAVGSSSGQETPRSGQQAEGEDGASRWQDSQGI